MRSQVKADGRVASGKPEVPGQPGAWEQETFRAGLGTDVRIQEMRRAGCLAHATRGLRGSTSCYFKLLLRAEPGCESRGGAAG